MWVNSNNSIIALQWLMVEVVCIQNSVRSLTMAWHDRKWRCTGKWQTMIWHIESTSGMTEEYERRGEWGCEIKVMMSLFTTLSSILPILPWVKLALHIKNCYHYNIPSEWDSHRLEDKEFLSDLMMCNRWSSLSINTRNDISLAFPPSSPECLWMSLNLPWANYL